MKIAVFMSVSGSIEVAGDQFDAGRMMVFRPGDAINVKAGAEGARLMLLGGETLNGPRYIWWNFVASAKDKIEAAKQAWAEGDWQSGRFHLPPGDIDVTMIAPKAPGHRMREMFVSGVGVPGLIAVHQNATENARELALAYGKGVGCTKAGVIETTFEEETETDLFGEQVVLCGGVTALVKTAFETLVQAGYQPEIAYFECMHELKLIVDLMYRGGLNYMRYSVSDTAEHGDYTGGPRLVNDDTRAEMKKMLEEIRSGVYADKWIKENEAGRPWFDGQRSGERGQLIEQVGARLRTMMPFLDAVEVTPEGEVKKAAPGPEGAVR